jgi:hypothetical protein
MLAVALGVAIAARGAAQPTRADTLGVLRALARAVQADPAGTLGFEPGYGWEADTLHAAELLARLDLPAPGRRGIPAHFRCESDSGAPPGTGKGHRVSVGLPKFSSADGATIDVTVGCATTGPHARANAQQDLLVLVRARDGTWRVVSRTMMRIT